MWETHGVPSPPYPHERVDGLDLVRPQFLTERYAGDANRKNSIHIGIAERYDLVVPQAGGSRFQAGDYIHFNGRSSKFSEGGWGIIRVYDRDRPT